MKKWTASEIKYAIEQIRQGKSIKNFIDELPRRDAREVRDLADHPWPAGR